MKRRPDQPSALRMRETVARIRSLAERLMRAARVVGEAYEREHADAYWPGRGGEPAAVGRSGSSDPTGRAVLDRDLAYVRATLGRVERLARQAAQLLERADEALATCWQETDPVERERIEVLRAEITD